jgi:hypothetical protein
MTESQFQTNVIKKLKRMFPGCEVQKMDASYQQGFPDLLILWKDRWAVLEVKASALGNVQPNQDFYINRLGEMSFAAYIYPENEREVLNALQQAFDSSRRTRVLKS